MLEKPDITLPEVQGTDIVFSDSASAHAPFIYFEQATAFGLFNGLIRVTLEACRLVAKPDNQLGIERVIVGHLRMSIGSAQSLRNALDKALLIAQATASESKN